MTVRTLRQPMADARGPHGPRSRCRLAVCAVLLIAGLLGLDARSASGQTLPTLTFPERPRPEVRQGPSDGQMLVQAGEIHYDYVNERVSAVGNVQIYYKGSTLEADRVVYDQKNKRLRAEGNARLTEPNGQVTHGQIMELSEDYRDGFVDSLRIELPDQSRIAAARGDRSAGRFSVFESGVYTACAPCKDDPKKPPQWQVKAARIIHDQSERMIYFEDASLELFGLPIAYLPYLSAPDPTVKRKTGLLAPVTSSSSRVGYGFGIPFYWAIAPDYDLTLTPVITTRQGVLVSAEWRQRLIDGAYFIRGAGIRQSDPAAFTFPDGTPQPGFDKDFRGAIESSGQFALNNKWVWGWDVVAPTDRYFFRDYAAMTFRQTRDPTRNTPSEGVSDLYLAGRGDRSYFDARAIYFYGFSALDSQKQLPVIHPVLDYSYIFGQPILGGELGYRVNVTSLSRTDASFDPLSPAPVVQGPSGPVFGGPCGPLSADPAVKIPANCLLRGFPGTYTRFSAEAHWRRTLIDGIGQVFTPFLSLRADAAAFSVTDQPGVSNYLPLGDHSVTRLMPTAGLEYRYPFIGVQSWGTHTIEPIAQIILRPNETSIGQMPNEDAQSLVFDDSNLFKVDKFAGWDRVEGGGRANVGIQYTAQVNRAGFFNLLFGQSYHLFGVNSFAIGDIANTGLNSGLDTDRSDYVARAAYQPNRHFMLTSRFRFDHNDMSLQRFELEGQTSFDRWTVALTYGNYGPQPELGFPTRREGIAGTAQVKLARNWNLLASARYDLTERKVTGTALGVGYVDDCLILAVNYLTNYNYIGGQQTDHVVMLQVVLRTLGGVTGSQTVSGFSGGQ
jgi:LPS-assembly protein